jgi:hypothetical protein
MERGDLEFRHERAILFRKASYCAPKSKLRSRYQDSNALGPTMVLEFAASTFVGWSSQICTMRGSADDYGLRFRAILSAITPPRFCSSGFVEMVAAARFHNRAGCGATRVRSECLPAFSEVNLTSSEASEPKNRRPNDSRNCCLQVIQLHFTAFSHERLRTSRVESAPRFHRICVQWALNLFISNERRRRKIASGASVRAHKLFAVQEFGSKTQCNSTAAV